MVALLLLPVQVWGAGGSLKVTILQSSDSRAFSTVPLTPGPRASDSTSATPAAASTPSKQALQFFCYICKAGCSSQQVPSGVGVGDLGGGWRVWGLYVMPSLPFPGLPLCPLGPPSPTSSSCTLDHKTSLDQPRGQAFRVGWTWCKSALTDLCGFWKVEFKGFEALVPQFLHASEETFRNHL